MGIRTQVLAAQSARRFIRERLLGQRIDHRQIAVAKGAFEPSNFMHDTALLFGVGQMGRQRGGQSGAAITHDHLNRRRIQAAPEQRGQ